MAKTISDEIIIASLIKNGTVRASADAIGISEKTIHDRMRDGEFKVLYKIAKADIIRKAIFDLNNSLGDAVKTTVEIMSDKSINPAIRLQAAQTILNNANKFSERLEQDENKVSQQREDNTFSLFDF